MKTKQVTQQDTSSDPAQPPIVAVLTRRPGNARRRLLILCVIGVAIVAVVVGGAVWMHYRHINSDRNVYAAQQRTLEGSLSLALNQSDFQTEVDATTQLINGKAAGHFTVSSQSLAQYYMERGAARLNLQQYTPAVADFQKARSIDTSLAQASLQAEVQARYSLGQRQQLIPLFQRLATLAKSSSDQRSGTPQLYQQYIDALQHNQEIQLQ